MTRCSWPARGLPFQAGISCEQKPRADERLGIEISHAADYRLLLTSRFLLATVTNFFQRSFVLGLNHLAQTGFCTCPRVEAVASRLGTAKTGINKASRICKAKGKLPLNSIVPIWFWVFWVYCNKIPIYPIFYLLKGDYRSRGSRSEISDSQLHWLSVKVIVGALAQALAPIQASQRRWVQAQWVI